MTIDTQKLRRMNKLPMALGILECPKEGGPIRFAQMRTVVDCGIEVWGQKQIDEHTENLWATIDTQAAETARLREAVTLAFGHLWHYEPELPDAFDPDRLVRAALSHLSSAMTDTNARCAAIDRARAALAQEQS